MRLPARRRFDCAVTEGASPSSDKSARFKELAALLDQAGKETEDARNSLSVNQAELDAKSQDCADLAARLDAAALERQDTRKTMDKLRQQVLAFALLQGQAHLSACVPCVSIHSSQCWG